MPALRRKPVSVPKKPDQPRSSGPNVIYDPNTVLAYPVTPKPDNAPPSVGEQKTVKLLNKKKR